MSNKNLIIGAIILLIIAVGGSYYFLANSSSKQETIVEKPQEEVILTIAPEELGLEVDIRNDKKALRFTLSNVKDVESIEYNITYTKEINGEEVPEGLLGQVDVASDKDAVGINYREFGTCSSGVCRYDKVVSPVKLTLKIVKKDGKTYSSEKSITL